MFATSRTTLRLQSSTMVTARHRCPGAEGHKKKGTLHEDPPSPGSTPRLIRASTSADSAPSPSVASRFSPGAGPRSVHPCGSVTVTPLPAVQMNTRPLDRRTARHTRNRRPASGWNGCVTSSVSSETRRRGALCDVLWENAWAEFVPSLQFDTEIR